MTDRLRPIPPDAWTDAQREAAHEIVNGPRGALYGPFVPLLRSPELMGHAQRLGEYLRYRSAIGVRLSELAILVTAREWDQQVEWAIHAPIARQAGITGEVINAIARRERPQAMLADEEVVVDFCLELHRDKRVSDRVYEDALALFGEQGVVDLMGVNGYYTFLAMVMNAAQTEAPPSSADPLPGRGM
jgi:4-carboxymuconolactone decarboxylase